MVLDFQVDNICTDPGQKSPILFDHALDFVEKVSHKKQGCYIPK